MYTVMVENDPTKQIKTKMSHVATKNTSISFMIERAPAVCMTCTHAYFEVSYKHFFFVKTN